MLSKDNSLLQLGPEAEATLELSTEAAALLMSERAAKLSVIESVTNAQTNLLEVISFLLAGERMCLEACYVHEIIPFTAVTRVPGVPEFVTGVINLHGQLVALMDLRHILGLNAGNSTQGLRIIVIGTQKIEFSVLVDSVESVAAIDATTLLAPPEFVSGSGRDYVKGITRDAMTVLDGSQLITDPRLFVNQNEVHQKGAV